MPVDKNGRSAAAPKRRNWMIQVRRALCSANQAQKCHSGKNPNAALYYINSIQTRLKELLEENGAHCSVSEREMIQQEEELEQAKWQRLECGYWADPITGVIDSSSRAYAILAQRKAKAEKRRKHKPQSRRVSGYAI